MDRGLNGIVGDNVRQLWDMGKRLFATIESYQLLHQFHWFSREGSYQAMVIDKLGPSLDKVLKVSPGGTLQLHHIAGLGLQMVSCT